MSLDLDVDPGPAVLAEAGAGLSVADGCRDQDLSAPFSLTDEVRLRPGRSLGAALLGGVALGLLMGRTLGHPKPPTQRV
jgi:hypothetical protein